MDKKILIVGWKYPPDIDGGMDVHVKHLFEELRAEGIDVSLALPEEHAPERDGVIGIETEGGILEKARDLSSGIAEISGDYDIVHTHDWLGAEAGFKARKYGGANWISTMHSLCSDWSREGSWRDVERLEKVAVEEADELVAVSRSLSEDIEDKYGREAQVIHNGFSTPESKGVDVKEKLGIEGDMVFFVGRHAEQKGVEHLLYGFKKFLENGDAELVIGGDGYMRESLEKFAEMLGIEGKVHFEGFIDSDLLGDYYRAAEVFVSPSISEPFGLTITEALASGTTVVATESGAEEIAGHSIIGIKPNSDSIAAGIREGLEKNPEFEASRSWGEMTEEVIEAYRAL